MGHIPSLVFKVQHHLVLHRLMEFIRVDVGAEYIPRHLFIFPEQRGAGESNEDGVGQPTLHLPVHIAALIPVAFVHEYVEPSLDPW